MAHLTVVDLFCGTGGFSLGFRQQGFKILLGIDINHSAARSYALNFPSTTTIEDDIRNITSKDIIDLIGGKPPDIVIGSPPCEPFTAANPFRLNNAIDRLYLDDRGTLTLEYIRLIGELRPKVFVMENVPAIAETRELKEALTTEFMKNGYRPIFNFLHAEDYGNPSRRTRVFISNIAIYPVKDEKRVTVGEAINDLEERFDIPNNEITELSEKKIKEISKLSYGDYLTMFRSYKGDVPIYIRLNPYDIAPTVLGNSRFIHPFHDRFLTVREQARLMSYPDDHVFIGSKDEQYNQIGESVPVVLSNAIASYIKVKIFGHNDRST